MLDVVRVSLWRRDVRPTTPRTSAFETFERADEN